MLRILDEEGIDSALDYVASQSTRLLEKASAKSDAARADLQPLLTGAQLAIANGQPGKGEDLLLTLIRADPSWIRPRKEMILYLGNIKAPRAKIYGTLSSAREIYQQARTHISRLAEDYPEEDIWQNHLCVSFISFGDIAFGQGNHADAECFLISALKMAKKTPANNPRTPTGNIFSAYVTRESVILPLHKTPFR